MTGGDPGADARRRFRGEPLGTRLHVRARLATAPLDAVVAAARAVTAAGVVVEVGTGHGLVAMGIAAGRDRPVLGVDIDPDKIAAAQRVAGADPELAALSFEVVAARWRPPSGAAVVVFADVLYLLHPADQQDLLTAAAEAVVPGGAVVVKETDDRPAWKRRWTAVQEAAAVHTVTRRSAATATAPTARQTAAWLAAAGLSTTARRLDARRPWPHYLVIGRRPSG
ncbi:MAG: Methyltransferase type 12 [Acidimicrobiales bacterium]|nr:Methyltransferase type 12 [Acidimicrobiales bacterium]